MRILRTPDERFADLPDFPYSPHYAQIPEGIGEQSPLIGERSDGEIRMAYLDEGDADAPVVVMLHGEPSWSFLYRKMIGPLTAAGYRVIVPDLIGFGRSDKPADVADHTYARHVEWVRSLLFDRLELSDITIVGQDWGGMIGLRVVAENPDRIAGFVVANTGLVTGDQEMPEIWLQFREALRSAPTLDVARFIQSGSLMKLPREVLDAYDAPFPDESFKAGARAMPSLVPTTPDDPASEANRRAWQILATTPIPALVAFSDSDPITGAMAPILARVLPGAASRENPSIVGAGHFLQEDKGEVLATEIVTFLEEVYPR